MANRRQYKIEQQCGLCGWFEPLCRQKYGKEYKSTECVQDGHSAFWPVPVKLITYVENNQPNNLRSS